MEIHYLLEIMRK